MKHPPLRIEPTDGVMLIMRSYWDAIVMIGYVLVAYFAPIGITLGYITLIASEEEVSLGVHASGITSSLFALVSAPSMFKAFKPWTRAVKMYCQYRRHLSYYSQTYVGPPLDGVSLYEETSADDS